jgi:hypothetical protein
MISNIQNMLLLTYLSIPIRCHSFQTRQCWYCYHLYEFFIPSTYCYMVRIPETLLLTSHSFLADDRTVPNPPVLILLPSLRILHSPHVLLHVENSWDIIANIPFVACIRSCNWYCPAMLLLTGLFTTNQSSYFYSRFVYLHIFLGVWFPTSQLDRVSVIANKLRI